MNNQNSQNSQNSQNKFSSSNEQMEQTDYYNNDSYYENSNYSTNNYSDTTYEEKEKKDNKWLKILLLVLIILIIIILLLKFCGNSNSSSKRDEEYATLTNRICDAAKEYIMSDTSISVKAGEARIVKFQALADKNLIETQIKNPYYNGGLFKKSTESKYYSLNNSVRITMNADGTYYCELVDNSKDVTAPELRLNGDAEITMAVGTEFVDPGYTATDDYDGDVTNKVVISGTVNNAKAGTYELTYTVSDTAGNTTSKKRTVIFEELGNLDISMGSVLDGVTPQISLKGANPYCMVKGGNYLEPGATATDNVDGNITDKIVVTNKVTGNLMGAFRIVYKVEDSSGNQAIAYRAVIVTTSCPDNNKGNSDSNSAPVITLIGKNSVVINVGTEYVDLGATAYDKEDGDITSKLVTDTSRVNTNAAGIYKVWYRVTDSAGKTTSASRTVTVKNPNSQNAAVRFTEDKKNIEVYTGEGSDSLITAPKAVNESGNAVTVTTKIEKYETKETVSAIDWSKSGKYRVIYTAIHGNGTIKQDKSIVVTIKEGKVTIGGKNPVNVGVRNDNCNITEADLKKGGVTFTTTGNKAPIITIKNGEDKACKKGTYTITVIAKVDGGEETTKDLTVYVVDDPNVDVSKLAPGKVQINTNSAVPYNPHNTNGVWAGGTTTAIDLMFSAIPAQGTEIGHFEWSKDCKNTTEKVSKTHNINEGTLSWKTEGKNEICIRAVSTDGIAGPWSDPVKLYLDRTGPTVKFIHDWSDEENSWHNTPTLKVEYTASDSESGLDHYEYTYDDVMGKKGPKITSPVTINDTFGSVEVSENTETARKSLFMYVRAVDKAGNVGEWTTNPAYINIDTVKPQAPTLEVKDNNSLKVLLNVTAFDNVSVRPSQVSMFVYTLNDGQEITYNKEVTINESCSIAEGELKKTCSDTPTNKVSTTIPIINESDSDQTYKVKVWAVDKAGNMSDGYAEDTITVKKSVPVKEVQIKNGDTNVVDGGSCIVKTTYVGDKFKLTAVPIPSDATEKTVSWSSSDRNIAIIDENGNITAKKAGEVKITATIGGKSSSCTAKIDSKATPQTPSNPGNSSGSGGGGGTGPSSGGSQTCKEWCVVSKDGTVKEYETYEKALKGAEGVAYKGQATIKNNNKEYSKVGLAGSSSQGARFVETKTTGTTVDRAYTSYGTIVNTTNNTPSGGTQTVTRRTDTSGKTTVSMVTKDSSGNKSTYKPSGKGGCFLAGTKVLTETGYKDIDKITIGEKVLSYNEFTKTNEYKTVLKTFVHNDMNETLYKLLVNGNIIEVTSLHRFYVKTESGYDWIAAKDLNVGDVVMNKEGQYYTIDSITNIQIRETVYNLSVEDNHNYYVTEDNILVHNLK